MLGWPNKCANTQPCPLVSWYVTCSSLGPDARLSSTADYVAFDFQPSSYSPPETLLFACSLLIKRNWRATPALAVACNVSQSTLACNCLIEGRTIPPNLSTRRTGQPTPSS